MGATCCARMVSHQTFSRQSACRPSITSHGDASGSRDSPRHWTSSRTRCTCCRQGRAGEPDPGRTRIRARSSTSRTIRSASRRPDARESGLNRTRIHARSSSNRNVCILSPCQFSFRRLLYQISAARAVANPIAPGFELGRPGTTRQGNQKYGIIYANYTS